MIPIPQPRSGDQSASPPPMPPGPPTPPARGGRRFGLMALRFLPQSLSGIRLGRGLSGFVALAAINRGGPNG
ncbi:hypothetical protein [Subtercola lobariae]|uniref:hypothetical protein n=1 Tax=Subtercola lobariae TaxID=1588641 RepID=UPI00166D7AB8|nr:hypothetical protein [Subtercola lobariae]